MIPKACKRLAEVDFPIAVVSKHAAREKSIRHGHPSTLHLWWARRPLAACRAVLLGLLLPDPCDVLCPADFKAKARELLPPVQGIVGPQDEDLRKGLLRFIGDFANWDYSSDTQYLKVSRGLVHAAHPEESPLVVDPFAGGGSIPLEALRLGCETFASDLNPVAGLILKVMLEDIPRYGRQKVKVKRPDGEEVEAEGLAEALRLVGADVKAAAEKELAEFYPPDPDGARPIAYLWARTVRCEAPNCGAEIPLVRSFWLSKKASRKRAIRVKVKRQEEKGERPEVEFEIFEPRTDKEVPPGTVSRARATCLCCGTVLPPERVRTQLSAQHGGADVIFDERGNRIGGARLLAVVTLRPGEQGRHYRLPTAEDYQVVRKAHKRLEEDIAKPLPGGLSMVPDEPLPPERQKGNSGFRVLLYGMETFGDLFTARQKLAMVTLRKVIQAVSQDNTLEQDILGLALSRFSDISNASCRWENTKTQVRNLFTRHDIPMTWDFAEPSLFGEQAGDYTVTLGTMTQVIQSLPQNSFAAQVQLADACQSPLPDDSATIWFTDPPYYDAVAYSDLSDFFFVWLKRVLPGHPLLRDPFDPQNPLTPKTREAVQDMSRKVQGQSKGSSFYEMAMAAAFAEGYRILKDNGIGSVVFAHQSTEGWEALLTGMIRGGWVVTGSWPIATEMGTRLIARDSAALATSIISSAALAPRTHLSETGATCCASCPAA